MSIFLLAKADIYDLLRSFSEINFYNLELSIYLIPRERYLSPCNFSVSAFNSFSFLEIISFSFYNYRRFLPTSYSSTTNFFSYSLLYARLISAFSFSSSFRLNSLYTRSFSFSYFFFYRCASSFSFLAYLSLYVVSKISLSSLLILSSIYCLLFFSSSFCCFA